MTGEELKTIRETAGLAKGVFAKTIGITPLMQGRYEGGKISIPDSVAEAVAKAYSPSKNQIADAVKEEITRLVSDFNAGSDEKFDLGSIEVTVKEEPGSENTPINKDELLKAVDEAFGESVRKAMSEDQPTDLKDKLKALRISKNLTKAAFAKMIGVSGQMVTLYENGKSKPREEVMKKIADSFGKDWDAILTGTDFREVAEPAEPVSAKAKETGVERKKDEKPEAAAEPVETDKAVAEETAANAKEKAVVEKKEDKKPAPRKQTAKKQAAKDKEVPARKENPAKAKKPSTTKVFIESMLGGSITTEEILKKIPKGTTEVYVKPEENKAYWVKGDKTGSVDLW